MKTSNNNIRVYITVFCVLCFAITVLIKAAYMQVLNSDYSKFLKKRYKKQILKTLTIFGERGKILDRNNEVLAISNKTDSVYIKPKNFNKKNIKVIAQILEMPADVLYKKISKRKKFLWVKRKVDKEISKKLKSLNIKGIGFLEEYRRFYPYNEIASNLIGFCNIDNKGAAGIEYKFDNDLKGRKVKIPIVVDAKKRPTSAIYRDKYDSAKGNSVKLTIDIGIQSIVENEIKLWVKSFNAVRATAIIMSPDSGKIIAMASYPDFNPNYYYKFPSKFYKNLAISFNYEPGSTVKPLVISWALNKRMIDLNWEYDIFNGYYRFKRLIDLHDHGLRGVLNIRQILIHSSNIGMAQIADYLGKETIYKIFKDFGFGDYTGIELPGEEKGIVKPLNKFSAVTHATMSFGQGIAVTPIQLITAYASVVNGGYLLRPFIVDEILSPQGKIILKNKKLVKRKILSEKVSKEIKQILVDVVKKGTGRKTRISYISIGGKTGTAQIPDPKGRGYLKGNYISSFIGFFPANNPKCLMLLIIEKPKNRYYASDVVCPIFKKISEEIIPLFGIESVKRFVAEQKKKDIKKVVKSNKFTGLSKLEVLNILRKKKITNFQFIGSGFVTNVKKVNKKLIFYFGAV